MDTAYCEGVEKRGDEDTEPQKVKYPSDNTLIMIDGVCTNEEKKGRARYADRNSNRNHGVEQLAVAYDSS